MEEEQGPAKWVQAKQRPAKRTEIHLQYCSVQGCYNQLNETLGWLNKHKQSIAIQLKYLWYNIVCVELSPNIAGICT